VTRNVLRSKGFRWVIAADDFFWWNLVAQACSSALRSLDHFRSTAVHLPSDVKCIAFGLLILICRSTPKFGGTFFKFECVKMSPQIHARA